MSISFDGTKLTPFEIKMFSKAPSYTKISAVHAIQTLSDGVIETLEGSMEFKKGDYIVSDDPPTHVWPVKQHIFEKTYVLSYFSDQVLQEGR